MSLEQWGDIVLHRTKTTNVPTLRTIDFIPPHIRAQRLICKGHSAYFAYFMIDRGGMHTLQDVIDLGSKVGERVPLIQLSPANNTFAEKGKIQYCKGS